MSDGKSDIPFRDVSGRPKGPLASEDWNERWRSGNTPWDMGGPSPPFVSAIRENIVSPPGRALVPGCGAGHEARLLTSVGYETTGIDLSPLAVERARSLGAEQDSAARFEVADLFDLPPHLRQLDLVLEHTCFCAILPSRRDEYVEAVADALRPGGRLLGLFFLIEPQEGPPFGATQAEIRHRFGPAFTIDVARTPENSHSARQDREMLFAMTRRG